MCAVVSKTPLILERLQWEPHGLWSLKPQCFKAHVQMGCQQRSVQVDLEKDSKQFLRG